MNFRDKLNNIIEFRRLEDQNIKGQRPEGNTLRAITGLLGGGVGGLATIPAASRFENEGLVYKKRDGLGNAFTGHLTGGLAGSIAGAIPGATLAYANRVPPENKRRKSSGNRIKPSALRGKRRALGLGLARAGSIIGGLGGTYYATGKFADATMRKRKLEQERAGYMLSSRDELDEILFATPMPPREFYSRVAKRAAGNANQAHLLKRMQIERDRSKAPIKSAIDDKLNDWVFDWVKRRHPAPAPYTRRNTGSLLSYSSRDELDEIRFARGDRAIRYIAENMGGKVHATKLGGNYNQILRGTTGAKGPRKELEKLQRTVAARAIMGDRTWSKVVAGLPSGYYVATTVKKLSSRDELDEIRFGDPHRPEWAIHPSGGSIAMPSLVYKPLKPASFFSNRTSKERTAAWRQAVRERERRRQAVLSERQAIVR
jgi:hypothetical protein